MGSSGRTGTDADEFGDSALSGARSLLDQIKKRNDTLRSIDRATSPSNVKTASARNVYSRKSRVDAAEDLLRRMGHWFRRRNGVAPTRDVLREFRPESATRSAITPNIFKGLLMSMCSFKQGYWVLNDDDDDDDDDDYDELD